MLASEHEVLELLYNCDELTQSVFRVLIHLVVLQRVLRNFQLIVIPMQHVPIVLQKLKTEHPRRLGDLVHKRVVQIVPGDDLTVEAPADYVVGVLVVHHWEHVVEVEVGLGRLLVRADVPHPHSPVPTARAEAVLVHDCDVFNEVGMPSIRFSHYLLL